MSPYVQHSFTVQSKIVKIKFTLYQVINNKGYNLIFIPLIFYSFSHKCVKNLVYEKEDKF